MSELNDKLQPKDSPVTLRQTTSAIQFEEKYPEVQQRRGFFSQLKVKAVNMPIAAGTVVPPNKGDFAFQTLGTISILVLNVGGGTAVYYTPAGTL